MHKTVKSYSISCNVNKLYGIKNAVSGFITNPLNRLGVMRSQVQVLSPRLFKPMFFKSLRESRKPSVGSLFPIGRIMGRIDCAEGCFCPDLPEHIKAAIMALVKPFSGETE